jgi:hypothetical protein
MKKSLFVSAAACASFPPAKLEDELFVSLFVLLWPRFGASANE